MRQIFQCVCAYLTFLIIPATAQYTIKTFAGGVSADGLTGISQAISTAAIALDPSGNLYVVLHDESRVYKVNTNGTLTLIAGNGSHGFFGDNGPAVSASLKFPAGVTTDAAGNVYIADAGNNRVRKVSNGVITTFAGDGGISFSGDNGSAINASVNSPAAVVVDNNSNVYIAEGGNYRVRKVSNGIITTVAGIGTPGSSGDNGPATSAQVTPTGIAVDGAGNLYIADTTPYNYHVRKVSNGIITTVAGTAAVYPSGIALDSTGTNLYIADGDATIRKVTGGIMTTVAGTGSLGFNGDGLAPTSTQLWGTGGVAIDSAGTTYVADEGNHRVRKIASNIVSTVVGGGSPDDGGPAASAIVLEPSGVAVDASDNIYIADFFTRLRKITNGVISTVPGFSGSVQTAVVDTSGNIYTTDISHNNIRKVTSGVITTVAGNGTFGFSGDNGPATSASLGDPSGDAVDGAGNLYIADTFNHRIRKVSNGIITTIAGNGTPGFSGDNGPATNAQLNYPYSISADSSGSLYVADLKNDRIRKIAGGIISTVAGGGNVLGDGGPATNASLFSPHDAIVDSSGDLFISDSNQRIRKVSAGIITTIAGNGIAGLSGDGGPGANARIDFPAQLARDSSGKIYFADNRNNAFRVLTPYLGIRMTHSGNFGLGQAGAVYTVTVTNSASSPLTSGAVTVAEILPPGLSLAGMSGVGWSCSLNTCTRSDTLNPGSGYPVITVKVNVSLIAASPQANRVSVSGGGSGTASFTDPTAIVATALSLSRNVVNFAVGNSVVSSPQQVAVNFSNGGAANWTVSSNQSNIIVSRSSGTGNEVFQVSVTPGPAGTVTVSAPSAGNTPQTVQVNIANATTAPPFGSFDTPATNTSGVVGAIPVTGWALDNFEVTGVDIWREPVTGEPAGSLIFVGNAVFVADARPDVLAMYPTYPFNYRAGWGYQMLTNFLPNSSGAGTPGNGTYKIHAIAYNNASLQFDLGTKMIVVDNAHAAKPFGTLDTPAQGGTVSGHDYVNFGWALTPKPATIPIDGSTMTVAIDGLVAGQPTYNQFRSDIASLFPGYANSGGAVGFFHLDTTTLTNGVHTISWNAYDNLGRGEGLGSRYFNVSNTTSGTAVPEDAINQSVSNANYQPDPIAQDPDGSYSVTMEEVGRIELHLGAASGNMLVQDEAHALPIGSTLKGGIFYWQPGPGFLGEYKLQFERLDGTKIPVRVTIVPKRFP